jgi:hypothetical protein
MSFEFCIARSCAKSPEWLLVAEADITAYATPEHDWSSAKEACVAPGSWKEIVLDCFVFYER